MWFCILVLDLKSDKGMLCRGPAKDGIKPAITIRVEDDVFADWILFKITADQVRLIFNFITINSNVMLHSYRNN